MLREEAIEHLERAKLTRPVGEQTLYVKVFNPGTLGGSPCVAVSSIHAGIDWDAGKILINTHEQLTVLSQDDLEAIRQSVKGAQSWHAFQSYKKQADRIKILEMEVASLKAVCKNHALPAPPI